MVVMYIVISTFIIWLKPRIMKGMCKDGISTTRCSKVYVSEISETGSLQAISCIINVGRFTVFGRYKYGGINNRPVITENKLVTKAVIIEK